MTTAKVHVSPTTLLFHFEQGLILQFGDVEMAAGVEPTLPRKTAGSGPTASEKQEHYRAMIKWKDARSDVSRFREVGIACIMISAAPLASILANESTLSSVPGIQGLDRTFIFFRSRAEAENLLRKNNWGDKVQALGVRLENRKNLQLIVAVMLDDACEILAIDSFF